ncbi:MAG: nucleoside hydrolase [Acidobacteriaceae bacterium]
MLFRKIAIVLAALLLCAPSLPRLHAQEAAAAAGPKEKVIIDSDIGDDIDDAFALALAVSSPRLQVLGVTTAWGDTDLRARLATRFLVQTGHGDIPVAAGPRTHSTNTFTQERWAEAWPRPAQGYPSAIDFIRDQVRRYPGQITLIAIAPFSNLGALIHADPAAFHQLRRVVLMGGSIRRGYGDLGYLPSHGPSAEYNVAMDVPASQALFTSGVPIFMMPLDSTQLKLDEVLRATLFSQDTRVTDALDSLYQEWTYSTNNPTPTLYDAMAVASVIDPDLCPTHPMHIVVDDKGFTRVAAGAPNANVCLSSDSDRFFHFYMHTVLEASGR